MQDIAEQEIARGISALVADMPTRLDGDLTIYRAAELRQYLAERVDAGDSAFDLSGVGEIDGAGVQLLLALDATLTSAGRRLELSGLPRQAIEALAVCGLDARLQVMTELRA